MSDKERGGLSGKIDHICRVIFLTEEGKPKSTTLIYSFSLSLVFSILLLLCYLLLVDPIELGFTNSPVWVRQVLEYLVPGLLGVALCVSLSFALKKREKMGLVAAAFTWVDIITVLMIVSMMFIVDRTDWKTEYSLFMMIAGIPMLVSAVLGTVASQVVYRKRIESYDRRLQAYASSKGGIKY